MSAITRKTLLAVWLVISAMVGIGGCRATWLRDTAMEPLSATNRPYHLHVVGVEESGKPILLTVEQSSLLDYYRQGQGSKEELGPVLWESDNHPGGRFSFYIRRADLARVEGVLTKDLNSAGCSIKLKLLADNPAVKSQTIHLTYNNDDFTYLMSYEVKDGKVTPITYGDIVKADGFAALVTGFKLFALAAAIGMGAAMLVRGR